ncbi:hypothetical protein THAOC_36130, partial [Thalassiosira oceanica]
MKIEVPDRPGKWLYREPSARGSRNGSSNGQGRPVRRAFIENSSAVSVRKCTLTGKMRPAAALESCRAGRTRQVVGFVRKVASRKALAELYKSLPIGEFRDGEGLAGRSSRCRAATSRRLLESSRRGEEEVTTATFDRELHNVTTPGEPSSRRGQQQEEEVTTETARQNSRDTPAGGELETGGASSGDRVVRPSAPRTPLHYASGGRRRSPSGLALRYRYEDEDEDESDESLSPPPRGAGRGPAPSLGSPSTVQQSHGRPGPTRTPTAERARRASGPVRRRQEGGEQSKTPGRAPRPVPGEDVVKGGGGGGRRPSPPPRVLFFATGPAGSCVGLRDAAA